MKWENNFYHSWDVLKNEKILTFPEKTKYMTKEDKDYMEEDKNLKIKESGKGNEIIQDSSKEKNNYIFNINFSFNFMRNTYIIIDMSENSILVDFKPNRIKYIFYKLKKFIKDYFSYNYASSITIISTRNCTAEILSPLSHDPDQIINNIDSKIFGINNNSQVGNTKNKQFIPGGYFSLSNSLECVYELISSRNDDIHNDVLIINNSILSYDNTIQNDFLIHFKDKCEINVLSLELPFENLKELSTSTGGVTLQISKENKNINSYNSNGDMDKFLFYYTCKFTKLKNLKIVSPIKKIDNELDIPKPKYICFCHKKYQKIIYSCPDCGDPYCYIPFYCFKCQLLNIDNSFLNLLVRARNDAKKSNDKCFPYKFKFYYQQYLENNNYYIKNAESALAKLKVYEKEFRRMTGIIDLDDISYDSCNFGFKFKLLYYYIKFEKSRQNFYCDFKKNILEDSYADYVESKKGLFLKDCIRCSGCNNPLKIVDQNDFDDIIIYSNCLDLFCLDCYKYLINNNIECLECTD